MQVHPQQISPGEQYNIFYFVRNHTDATTYYVRAVVYDVETGAVLATYNLTQSSTNTRLFIKTAEAPTDPTGYGRSIVAIATIYTDSGYTTKSENYEEQEQYFLVKNERMFGGGGVAVDYDLIRSISAKAAQEAVKGINIPEAQKVSLEGVFGALGKLQETLNRVPKDAPDTTPLSDRLTKIAATLESLPRFEKTDLGGVEDALYQVSAQFSELSRAFERFSETMMNTQADATREVLNDMLTTFVDEVRARFDDLFKITEQKKTLAAMADGMKASFTNGMAALGQSDGPLPPPPKEASPDEIRHLLS